MNGKVAGLMKDFEHRPSQNNVGAGIQQTLSSLLPARARGARLQEGAGVFLAGGTGWWEEGEGMLSWSHRSRDGAPTGLGVLGAGSGLALAKRQRGEECDGPTGKGRGISRPVASRISSGKGGSGRAGSAPAVPAILPWRRQGAARSNYPLSANEPEGNGAATGGSSHIRLVQARRNPPHEATAASRLSRASLMAASEG